MKRREAVLAKAKEYAKEARGGANFDELAGKAGATVHKLQDIERNQATVEFDGAAVKALFGWPADGYAVAADNDGKQAKVIKSTPVLGPGFNSSSEEAKAIRKVLGQGIGNDLFGEYVTDLESAYGVKINDSLWQRLSGGSS